MEYVAVHLTIDGGEILDADGKHVTTSLGEHADRLPAIRYAMDKLCCTLQYGVVILKGNNRGGYLVLSVDELRQCQES